MDAQTLILGALIAFSAAACQSVTGFGFALVMAPLLAIAWDVEPAIATTVVLSLVTNILVLSQVHGHVVFGRLPGLYVGFAIGFIPGLVFLESVNADVLQVTVAAVVLVATVLLYFQPTIDAGHDSLGGLVAAGAASGASASATSMGGPPVVLYLMGREEMERFRATMLAFFLPTSLVTLIAFAVVGRLDSDVLTESGVATPALIAGVFAGAWLRGRINAGLFRRVVVAVLVFTSIVIIAYTLSGGA